MPAQPINNFRLGADVVAILKALAADKKCSEVEVVRKAIRAYARRHAMKMLTRCPATVSGDE